MRAAGLAMVAACALAACAGEPANETAVDAVAAGAGSEARQLFARFEQEAAADYASCFEGLPDLDANARTVDFTGPGGTRPEPIDRLVMAIDASGSMAARIDGETKLDAAKNAAREFLSAVPDGVSIGLVAFGHQGNNTRAGRAESCDGVDTLYPIGSADRQRISVALGRFEATGWTPLADAIEEAGRALVPSERPGAQVVYVVSDGEETCGGDPVAAARALHEGGTRAIVNVIGFDLNARDRAQLRAVAQAGGGSFVEARSGRELERLIGESRRTVFNTGAMAWATVGNIGAQARNVVATGGANARLALCMGSQGTREALAAPRWLGDAVPSDRPELRREIADLIEARRRMYQARADAYRATAETRARATNEWLGNVQEATREGYEAAR